MYAHHAVARPRLEAGAPFRDHRPLRPSLRFEHARHAAGRGLERRLRTRELDRCGLGGSGLTPRETTRRRVQRRAERFRERHRRHHPPPLHVVGVRRQTSLLIVERHVVRRARGQRLERSAPHRSRADVANAHLGPLQHDRRAGSRRMPDARDRRLPSEGQNGGSTVERHAIEFRLPSLPPDDRHAGAEIGIDLRDRACQERREERLLRRRLRDERRLEEERREEREDRHGRNVPRVDLKHPLGTVRPAARTARPGHRAVQGASRAEFGREPTRKPAAREGLKGVVERLRDHGGREGPGPAERVDRFTPLPGARVEVTLHHAVERAKRRGDWARGEMLRPRRAQVLDPLREHFGREEREADLERIGRRPEALERRLHRSGECRRKVERVERPVHAPPSARNFSKGSEQPRASAPSRRPTGWRRSPIRDPMSSVWIASGM